ncbi:rhamnulokinase [Polycladomyces sp. WAk]|uniref:Rhamnulokinase n=1 Tax=Polycladomyces zharkentensis TaxID=2807616 RepID=A0ABS2WJL5_9BACL|nr:rhamnulokinase family protein [Polycladomyces sp. WAk]MBN2909748.1 rhamnulokinase [Polycladomyces sp. WAk]
MAIWRGFAVDLGASNGRTVIGEYDGERLFLREIKRFQNHPVGLGDTLYWDFLNLFSEIQESLVKACSEGLIPSTVGVDTWGVDFGLIDEYGELVANPRHYRNPQHGSVLDEVFARVPAKSLYEQTGIQILQINTVFQLKYLCLHRPELLERSRHLLLFPDLINYFLTGEMASEFTNATTTQLFNPRLGTWAYDLIDRLGLPKDLFLPVVPPLRKLGSVRKKLVTGTAAGRMDVVNVGEHDTASAVLAVPYETDDFVYISSGTWSLVGVLSNEPIITDLTRIHNFTNEGGVGGVYRLLKNVMGLWILQEVRRMFLRSGVNCDFVDLMQAAKEAPALKTLFDPDAVDFLAPEDMIAAIQDYSRRTGQPVPDSPGEISRAVLESLALKYRWVIERLEEITGKSLPIIHIVGGGVKNTVLCQWTADATNRIVIAGPVEATVIGNLCAQLIASNELSGISDIPALVDRSFEKKVYRPTSQREGWDAAYERFVRLLKMHHSLQSDSELANSAHDT